MGSDSPSTSVVAAKKSSSIVKTSNNALTTESGKPWFDYHRTWEQYFSNPRSWVEWGTAWDKFLFDSVRNMGDNEIRRLKDSLARYCSGALIVAPTVYSSLWLFFDAMRDTYLLADELLVTLAMLASAPDPSLPEDGEKSDGTATTTPRMRTWRGVLMMPVYAGTALLRPFVHPYRQLVRRVSLTPRTSNDVRGHLAVASTACLLLLEAPLRVLVLRKYLNQGDDHSVVETLGRECLPAACCMLGMWLNFRGGMEAREKGLRSDETLRRRSMTQAGGGSFKGTSFALGASSDGDAVVGGEQEQEEGGGEDAPMVPRGQAWRACLFRLNLAAYSFGGLLFFAVGASAKINAIYFVLAPAAEQPGGVVPLLYKGTIAGLQAVPLVETAGNLGLSWIMGLPPLPIKFSNVSNQLLKTLKDTEIIPEYALTLAQAAPLISAILGALAFVYV